jgi:mRNA deadenylase 3'-5' endonuclease subunit Ccr4
MDEEQPLASSPLKEQQELQHQPTEETTIIDTSSFSTFSTSAEYQPIQRHVVHSNQSSLSNTSIADYSMGRTSPLESKSSKQDPTFHFTNQTHFFDRNALFMYNTRVLLVLIACIIPFFSLTGK